MGSFKDIKLNFIIEICILHQIKPDMGIENDKLL